MNNRWNSKCAKLGYAQCVMQIHICQDCTVVHKVDFKPDSCRLTLSPWALLSIVPIWLTHTHTHTHTHTRTHTHTLHQGQLEMYLRCDGLQQHNSGLGQSYVSTFTDFVSTFTKSQPPSFPASLCQLDFKEAFCSWSIWFIIMPSRFLLVFSAKPSAPILSSVVS